MAEPIKPEQEMEPTHCGMCRHPVVAHDIDPETGYRPCRSVGHPKGLLCADCRRLTSPEHVAAIMEMRNSDDPLLAAAFGAFSVTEDHVRHQLGDSWLAFHTDVYESAVASVLVEVKSTIRQEAREELLREMGLHPEQIAERENAPGRPDSREELLARIEQPIRRKTAERVLLVSEVARGLRCPYCHGKPATQPHPLDADPVYRCGAGHVWRRPLVIEDSSAHPEVLLRRVAETGELPPVPNRIEQEATDG